MAERTKVFISYSHDSPEHAQLVRDLADALRHGGLEVILDQYVHPAPEKGWPRWMDRNIDEAQFVLMVCTETYRRRVMDEEEPGKGLGVRWEGRLIYNRIYDDKPSGSQFIPILLLPGSEPWHIPNPVKGHAYYRIATFDLTDPNYEGLYRHLTGQAPDASTCPRHDHDLATETATGDRFIILATQQYPCWPRCGVCIRSGDDVCTPCPGIPIVSGRRPDRASGGLAGARPAGRPTLFLQDRVSLQEVAWDAPSACMAPLAGAL